MAPFIECKLIRNCTQFQNEEFNFIDCIAPKQKKKNMLHLIYNSLCASDHNNLN